MNPRQLLILFSFIAVMGVWFLRPAAVHTIRKIAYEHNDNAESVTLSQESEKVQAHEVTKLPLSPTEKSIFGKFEKRSMEYKLINAIIVSNHGGPDLGARLIPELQQNPEKAIAAIREVLNQLPLQEFPMDRAALLQVAADLPGQQEEVKALASRELNTYIVEPMADPESAQSEAELDQIYSSNPQVFVPMVAHSVLMNLSRDANEAHHYTVAGMNAQKDPNVRQLLADQYSQKYGSEP